MSENPDRLPTLPSALKLETSRLAARRRLARAGLAAPVVLGTLISKPVLGQVPYNCTISGQVSGNLSNPGDADCSVLGYTPTYWRNNTWPTNSGLLKGTLPNSACNFSGSGIVEGTLFASAASGFTEAFRRNNVSGNCVVFDYENAAYLNLTRQATLLQVLHTDPLVSGLPDTPAKRFGRAAVASLLNSYQFPSYPVSTILARKIFNQIRAQGFFQVNASVQWNRDRSTLYLESLFGGIG